MIALASAKCMSYKGETMSVVNITVNNFQEEVVNSEKPVLLDFWASWCGPCRMVSPIIDEISAERGDIKVGKVNVEEQRELAAQFRVMSIPSLVVMKDDGGRKTQEPDPCHAVRWTRVWDSSIS